MNGRVPGTFDRQWVLRPNPAYTGAPRILEALCHDKSPFITISCRCGGQLHQHESQTAAIPDDTEVASNCPECGALLVFPAGWFSQAFATLRREGWIA